MRGRAQQQTHSMDLLYWVEERLVRCSKVLALTAWQMLLLVLMSCLLLLLVACGCEERRVTRETEGTAVCGRVRVCVVSGPHSHGRLPDSLRPASSASSRFVRCAASPHLPPLLLPCVKFTLQPLHLPPVHHLSLDSVAIRYARGRRRCVCAIHSAC